MDSLTKMSKDSALLIDILERYPREWAGESQERHRFRQHLESAVEYLERQQEFVGLVLQPNKKLASKPTARV